MAGEDEAPVVDQPDNQNPAPEAPQAQETPSQASSEQEASSQEGQQAKPPEKVEDWRDKRIDRLTWEARESKRRADSLEAELRQLRQPVQDQGEKPARPSDADLDRIVNERAERIASDNAFNASCNEVHDKGTTEFPDFAEALGAFQRIGGLPRHLIEAAIDLGDAHKVLYQLGKNPGEAARIIDLPPARMGAALARMVDKAAVAPAPAVSRAAAPIKPIGGTSTRAPFNPETASPEEFDRWRQEQRSKRLAS